MHARRIIIVAAIVVASLVGIATVAVAGLRFAHEDQVLPGVSVEGVELGGMTAGEAADALQPLVEAREGDPVTLTWRDREFVVDPADIEYAVDVDATVAAALAAGRGEGFVGDSLNHVTSLWEERSVELQQGAAGEAVDEWLAAVATEVDRAPFPGAVSADASSLEVTVTPPDDGATVRLDDARTAIVDALRMPGPDTLELPIDVTPARITVDEVETVAEQARRALEAPLVLAAVGQEVTLQPSDIAPMIALQERSTGGDAWTVELAVPVEVVEDTFTEVASRFTVEPVSARIDAPRRPPVTFDDKDDAVWQPRPAGGVEIVPSQPGKRFDAELAASQLSEILAAGERSGELRLADVEAEFTTEDAEELGITEVLSTFTTYHACCQSRVTNIQRLADMVDGTIVEPGETFSINQISGERTCRKGFAEAGMILRGEIVDSCGGGVSQFGTTTVNAVFFAGIKPTAYKPHSFYISRYPMAREATLNYPSPDIDVRFVNTTGHGILIRTSYTTTSITVTFYGQNDVERVVANVGQPYNVKPYPTERRKNLSLAPESERRIQSGKNGFSVKLTRTIVLEDGSERSDDWSNVYVPETEIIEYNPTPKPKPSPKPPPEPSPSPTEAKTEDGGDGGDGSDG
jgi:vancomycin resistance protein YoaR